MIEERLGFERLANLVPGRGRRAGRGAMEGIREEVKQHYAWLAHPLHGLGSLHAWILDKWHTPPTHQPSLSPFNLQKKCTGR